MHILNKHSHSLSFSLLLALILLASCASDRVVPHETEGTVIGKEDRYSLTFRYGVGMQDLRAITEEPGDKDASAYDFALLNENKIASVQLFFFDNATGSKLLHFPDTEALRKKGSDNNYQGTLLLTKEQSEQISNKAIKIVLLANAKEDLSSIRSYSELQEKHEAYTDLNSTATVRESFLMDGEIVVNNIAWGVGVNQYTVATPISVKRALAKIRLRIDNIKVVDFQNGIHTEYEVVNKDINVKLVHFTPETSLLSTEPYSRNTFKMTDYREMEQRTYPDLGQFYGAFPFYAGEHKWDAGDVTQSTYMILRLKLRPKQHEPGDTGQYYYYRLPINYRQPMDGVPAERLQKVERNYLYDVVTTIEQLGSLDEYEAFQVDSHIAIKPWKSSDPIDGTITDAHYLVVKETHPAMANVDSYNIKYVSSLPVEVKVTKAYYEFYDVRGDYYRVVFSPTDKTYKFYKDKGETQEVSVAEITRQNLTKPDDPTAPFDAATVEWTRDKYVKDGSLTVKHAIPTNFAPFKIEIEVKQKNGSSTPLSEKVYVTQYPPIYVTGSKSIGQRPTEGDKAAGTPYADFRFHTSFGQWSTYQGGNIAEPQKNDIFNRVTIKVPSGNYSIGDPVDPQGYTRTDAISNQIVSPEFIIATQYGMSTEIPQKRGVKSGQPESWKYNYSSGYGPYAKTLFPYKSGYVYRQSDPQGDYHNHRRAYENAEERCHNYFEGEYGTDGTYTEWYKDEYLRWQSRKVEKKFKYQGRWRLPTAAEVRLIDQIQDHAKSVTKGLMYGIYYWTAQDGMQYNFQNNELKNLSFDTNCRCIFDTYTHDDKEAREVQ